MGYVERYSDIAMTLMYIAIGIFAAAAVFGVMILAKWLTKQDASRSVVYAHGAFAAVALVLLVIYALQNPDNYPKVGLVLFVLAALGGFYMFFRDLQKKMSP